MPFWELSTVRSWALAGVAVATVAGPASAQEAKRFEIPRQSLARALETFGQQSGKEILFNQGQTQNKLSSPVSGAYTPAAQEVFTLSVECADNY